MPKSSFAQIQKQIEELQRQAAQMREKEVAEVVGRIKEAIKVYGLTAADLGLAAGGGRATTAPRRRGAAASRAAKYSDGNGNTWGGRGPRPRWLQEAIKAGRKLEDFAVGSASSGTQAAKGRLRGGRNRSIGKPMYRDEAGNTWTGRGRKPGWFVAALESGKTAEQLRA